MAKEIRDRNQGMPDQVKMVDEVLFSCRHVSEIPRPPSPYVGLRDRNGQLIFNRLQQPEFRAILAMEQGNQFCDTLSNPYSQLPTIVMEGLVLLPIKEGIFLAGIVMEIEMSSTIMGQRWC
jgi:hypothetical protein